MRSTIAIWSLTWLAALCVASPSKVKRNGSEVAVYWGFGNERSLASYCAAGQGIDILIIGSVTSYNSSEYPLGAFGSTCDINADGTSNSGCAGVAKDIQTCQAAGVKILVGFSSDGQKWSIQGTQGASNTASALWQMYGGGLSNSSVPRPFGNVKVDGWDFDVESNPHNESSAYLGDLVNDLRDLFVQDTSKCYYISGAPECALPERNMGIGMMQAKFDYLWIQFYNNECSAADVVKNPKNDPDGTGVFNFKDWSGYLAGGASSNAALFVGIPASPSGATPYDYLTPLQLPKVFAQASGMSGVMLWNTAHSDASVYNKCTYAQNVAHLLTTGKTCPKP